MHRRGVSEKLTTSHLALPLATSLRVSADIPLIGVIGRFGEELTADVLHDAPTLAARLQEFVEKHAADQALPTLTPYPFPAQPLQRIDIIIGLVPIINAGMAGVEARLGNPEVLPLRAMPIQVAADREGNIGKIAASIDVVTEDIDLAVCEGGGSENRGHPFPPVLLLAFCTPALPERFDLT